MDLGVEAVRARVSQLLEVGSLADELIQAVFDGEEFAPYEGYLFDYKAKWPESKVDLRKLVRHIAAFHNVFGGYLFLGVQEVQKEKTFVPVEGTDPQPDVKQVKDLLREHLSVPIEISLRLHRIKVADGIRYVCALHIPKRARDVEPVVVLRGATDDKSRSVLEEGAVDLPPPSRTNVMAAKSGNLENEGHEQVQGHR